MPSTLLTTAAPLASTEHTVATAMILDADRARVWDHLMFYEQIVGRPPLHLRLVLPLPIGTTGRKSQVGDEARCEYHGGHLIKRVVDVDPGQRYAFRVVEQQLVVGGGMTLAGGDYALRELGPGRIELCITTRYTSPRRPRWLWQPIERAVCHSFHRHILRAMRGALDDHRGEHG
jgi:hypothetical protein